MYSRTALESVLDRVRPFLVADGGDVEIIAFEGDDIQLRLTGRCAGCRSAEMTLRFGVEAALRQAFPRLRVVQVH